MRIKSSTGTSRKQLCWGTVGGGVEVLFGCFFCFVISPVLGYFKMAGGFGEILGNLHGKFFHGRILFFIYILFSYFMQCLIHLTKHIFRCSSWVLQILYPGVWKLVVRWLLWAGYAE